MIVNKVLSLPRNMKRLIVIGLDMLIIPLALWCSFSLRLGEFFIPQGKHEDAAVLFLIAPVIAIPIFVKFGLYRAIIRYIGLVAMWAIVKAITMYTLVFGILILLSGMTGVPRSVILIYWLMMVLLVGATRALGRWWLRGNYKLRSKSNNKIKVLIYGAGDAGVQTAAALTSGGNMHPVAFIDDSHALQGNYIEGYRVYPFSSLKTLIEDLEIKEVILAMPSASRSRRNQLISMIEPYAYM